MSVWKIGAGVTESGAKVTPFSSVSERYSARSLHSLSYCFASPLIREYVALTESGILEKSAPPFSPSDTLHRPTQEIAKIIVQDIINTKRSCFISKNLANLQRTTGIPVFFTYISKHVYQIENHKDIIAEINNVHHSVRHP